MTADSTTRPAEIEFLRELRQSRKFTDQPVPEDVLNGILEVARWSGSSKNTQPWEFLIVRDRERLKRISEFGQFSGFLAGAAVAIVLIMDGRALRSESYDEGRLSERIMLAAKAYGLGSGTGWWGTEEGQTAVKAYLGIPQEKAVISAVGIGYAAESPIGTTGAMAGRKPLAELVHVERYGTRQG